MDCDFCRQPATTAVEDLIDGDVTRLCDDHRSLLDLVDDRSRYDVRPIAAVIDSPAECGCRQ